MSSIYLATLKHSRIKPKVNKFNYKAYFFYLDLDELDKLDKSLFLFSKNKWNVFSFRDKDHFRFIDMPKSERDEIMEEKVKLDRETYRGLNTKERVIQMCKDEGLDFEVGKVMLMTNLRLLGHLFNPVSFYFVYDLGGRLCVMISEVHNTFYDQKMFYTVIAEPSRDYYEAKQEKNFYISPFTDLDNALHWKFSEPGEEMMMIINSVKKGEIELATSITGQRKELNNKSLVMLFLRFPLYTIMIVLRIHLQALKLWFKKVPFNKKDKSDKYLLKKIKRRKL